MRERTTERILFKDESYLIMGACFEVYREKGNGFLEAVYQECLTMELTDRRIPFVEKPRLRLAYKGRLLTREYVPDFLCFDQIILEIKAVTRLTDEHRAQLFNYLRGTERQLGLLINFGHHPRLEFQRLVSPFV